MRSVALVLAATGCLSTPSRPAVSDAPSAIADAAVDGAPGRWMYTRTSGHTTQNVAPASPNSLQVVVAAGDLLVVMSDGETPSGTQPVSFSVMPAGIVTLGQRFENDQVVAGDTSGMSSTTAGTWGIVGPAAGASTTVTIIVTNLATWSDLSATVFSGGTAAAHQVDLVHTLGGAGSLVTCGPVTTVANGAAVYVAVRWTCADAPMVGPFTQLGTLAGNPYGMAAPTDGTAASATLTDCGNSGGWICSTLSLSP